MLAYRADKICREFFSFIYVAANNTTPYGFSGDSRLFRLGLDIGLIISIGG